MSAVTAVSREPIDNRELLSRLKGLPSDLQERVFTFLGTAFSPSIYNRFSLETENYNSFYNLCRKDHRIAYLIFWDPRLYSEESTDVQIARRPLTVSQIKRFRAKGFGRHLRETDSLTALKRQKVLELVKKTSALAQTDFVKKDPHLEQRVNALSIFQCGERAELVALAVIQHVCRKVVNDVGDDLDGLDLSVRLKVKAVLLTIGDSEGQQVFRKVAITRWATGIVRRSVGRDRSIEHIQSPNRIPEQFPKPLQPDPRQVAAAAATRARMDHLLNLAQNLHHPVPAPDFAEARRNAEEMSARAAASVAQMEAAVTEAERAAAVAETASARARAALHAEIAAQNNPPPPVQPHQPSPRNHLTAFFHQIAQLFWDYKGTVATTAISFVATTLAFGALAGSIVGLATITLAVGAHFIYNRV